MSRLNLGKKILFFCLSFSVLLPVEAAEKNFEIGKNLDIFNSLYRELDMFYVDTLDAEKVIRTGIDAMLESLDPYTSYIPETELEDFKFMTTGEYAGVGAVITMNKDKNIVVNEPYEGKPAAKAGLKAGDIILSIDGEKLQGIGVSAASEKLKGRPGTKIKLEIQRPGEKKTRIVPIERELIQIDAVTYSGVLPGNIGYIFLNNFTDKSGQEVRDALLDLKNNHHIESLILDLRGNPGGILEEAVQIVNLFVPKGELVVSTKGKVKQWDKSYRTTIEPVDTVMPLVVLTNSGSASASEIVSGALQDLDRAVILGTRTFGKGLVQSTREVAYDSNLKLTIAKYYIPSGRLIQALDYSHRNPDGSVGRVPDSLTNVFKTSKGRLVRDGGGINPDVTVESKKIPTMALYLTMDNVIFDYATQWVVGKDSIVEPELFSITDEDYESFKDFVKKRDFTYDRQSEKVLKNLKEVAEFEGYMDTASDEFKALEAKLKPDLDRDLDKFKPIIKDQINEEIIKRFYFQKGKIKNALRDDIQVKEAIKLLNDKEAYSKLLLPSESKPEEKK
ncbi:MAG: S41 family peptidase [Bacteroidales bacterium]|nr:S41 family peptidase [Bacteroidales bacterium]